MASDVAIIGYGVQKVEVWNGGWPVEGVGRGQLGWRDTRDFVEHVHHGEGQESTE